MAKAPWYIWSCVLAVTSGSVGAIWDISWHKSIGRDTFWTPAHLAIYLCGVLAGFTCGYLILHTTWRRESPLAASGVTVWGFRGPLGAFLCAWGGLTMLASAPFDDWWHNAYGLDVTVLSPPHVVLLAGMLAIRVGTLLMILGQMSHASGAEHSVLHGLLLFVITTLLAILLGTFQELTIRPYMHSAQFYLLVALSAPLWLAVVSALSPHRWACTIVAAIYTGYYLVFILLLPLFPAEPKLGPVYQEVRQFVPPDFPLLLLIPAMAIDWVRAHVRFRSKWRQAAVAGAVFLGAFLLAQWPFAEFLQSPAARNRLFGTHYVPFFVPPTSEYVRYVFHEVERTSAEFWTTMAGALGIAILMTRLGLLWGEGMQRIRR